MASLRIRADELVLKSANGTLKSKRVNYPGREYMAFSASTTDEEVLLAYYPGAPEEIVRTGGCVLAGPMHE